MNDRHADVQVPVLIPVDLSTSMGTTCSEIKRGTTRYLAKIMGKWYAGCFWGPDVWAGDDLMFDGYPVQYGFKFMSPNERHSPWEALYEIVG